MDYGKLWFQEMIRARINDLGQISNALTTVSKLLSNLKLKTYSARINDVVTSLRKIMSDLNKEIQEEK